MSHPEFLGWLGRQLGRSKNGAWCWGVFVARRPGPVTQRAVALQVVTRRLSSDVQVGSPLQVGHSSKQSGREEQQANGPALFF